MYLAFAHSSWPKYYFYEERDLLYKIHFHAQEYYFFPSIAVRKNI